MERPKQRVCRSQDRWSEDKEKEQEKITLCLYECLRAAGLQRHYARFISVGVLRAAHLSALTMEDYPILGVRSMEDRTRLYDLVQMVKTFDLESLEDENGDADYDADPVADNSLPYDGSGDPDEDIYDDEDLKCVAGRNLNAASFSKPSCVRRRLDFGCKTIDHHKHPFSNPEGIFLVDSSHTRSDDPGQGSELDIPVQIKLNTGSAVCSCRGNNNHRMDVHSHQSDHLTDANTKSDIMEEMSLSNSRTMLSPNYVSFHKPKPRLATVSSNGFCHEPVEHKSRKGISRKENIGRYGASVHMAKPAPVYESKRTAGYNYGLPLSLPTLPNKKQPGGQRISVCVRKRPLTHTECRRGETDVVTTSSGECVIVHECKEAVDLTQYILQHMFYFDQVFGEDSSNEEVYRRTAYPLVQHMLNGGKATCFAYGQTGAGKTHTMFGSSPGRPGLYTLAVRDIFAHLSTTPKQTALLVYVSFFEIYCGQMYDLLDHRKRLFAREDGQKVVHIAGLRDVRVDSVSSVLEVISQGTEERTRGISGVNPLSSRSHALLQIQLRGQNQQIAGRMWFVDLAGSERASDTKKSDRQSRMEGAEINQSLLALKECIRSLDQEQLHTPFRQSKLTQVLKDSFVGDSMTCMIANISPGHLATEHTLNTLRYADRVKELRGRGGQRRGRRGTTTPSPKHNLSNSSSSSSSSSEPRSVGIRGKSPPKKLKLVPQREALASTIPTTRLETEDAILCSTPKNSRLGKEGSARMGIGQIGQITPVKRFLEISDKRERAGGSEVRSRERYGTTDVEAGLVLGQATDEQLHLWVQRESDFYHIERQNLQSTLKGRREGGRIQIEQREQVESIADTSSELERLRERDLRKVDERDKERKRYLRQYHQQLQQCMPSTVHHLSSSTCSSFPSSNQASLSSPPSPSTCPSLRHSSHLSVSATIYNDLEEVLDAYRVGAEVRADGRRGQLSFVPSGEICLQAETSPSDNRSKDGASHGDSGSTSEDWRVSLKGTEARFEQNRGRNENRKSLKETAEREVSVRWGDRRPDVLAGGGQRGWAWVATTETEEPNGMTGARQAQALLSYNCDLEERRGVVDKGINDSDVPAVGVWSTKEGEGADGFMLVSTHSNNASHSPFNHSPFDSPTQHAPAERPLSPACEHSTKHLTHNKPSDLSLKLTHTKSTSDITPLPLQNAQQGVPSSSCRKKELSFAANATNAQLATPALTTAITQNLFKIPAETLNTFYGNTACSEVHNHSEVTSKMSVLPQEDTSTDHLSYAMYPQSISLLQVNQQAAKESFILGEKNSTSLCQLDNERWEDNRIEVDKRRPLCAEMEGKVVEDEFRLSLLELPQGRIHCPSTTDTMTATNHSKQRKNMCCATYEHCEIGMMEPLIPEVILVSLQDQENNQKPQTKPTVTVLVDKAPASPLTCSSMQTSDMLSISPFGNTGTPSPHNVKINGATRKPPEYEHNVHKKLAFSISTPMSESVLGQLNKMSKQSHTVLSNHCSNQQIRPIVDLSTLENLDKGQCRVVQAHWEQLQEMEALFHKEGTLLCQQPDMAFGEYVYKLDEIMARKAQCVYSLIAQLQPYLKPSHSIKTHNQGEANHGPIT